MCVGEAGNSDLFNLFKFILLFIYLIYSVYLECFIDFSNCISIYLFIIVSSNKPCDNATRSRPLSGCLTKTKSTTSSSKKSREYIDPIEGELKMTTKALQDRLGISKQGMV